MWVTMYRGAALVAVIVVCAALVGCTGGRADGKTTTQGVTLTREATWQARVRRAVASWREVKLRFAREAERAVESDDTCNGLIRQAPRDISSQVLDARLIVADYLRLARSRFAYRDLRRELNDIPAAPAAVRRVASAMAQLEAEIGKIARADRLRYCNLVRAWAAANWSPTFEKNALERYRRDAGIDVARVRSANKQILTSVEPLVRSGLSVTTAVRLGNAAFVPELA